MRTFTQEQVIEILDKQHAYDMGATDSGVNDQELLGELLEFHQTDQQVTTEAIRWWLIRNLIPPYGPADCIESVSWLDDRGFDF